MSRAVALAALLGLALATDARAQMTPLWKLACTPQSYPLCNASGHDFNTPSATCTNSHCKLGTLWSAVYMPGAGPGGADVVRVTIIGIPNPTVNDEFYLGWTKSIAALLAPQQGDSRYFRWVMRVVSPVIWFGLGGGRWGTKFIIGGSDGTNDGNRLFDNLRSATEGDVRAAMFRTEKNVSAGRLDLQPLPADRWLPFQVEVRFSSTASATDARLRKWMDAGDVNAPTGQTGCASPGVPANCTAYNWAVAGWSGSNARVSFGGYAQAAMQGSNVVFDLVVSGPGAFEYDDEFDPGWHLRDTPAAPPPAAPAPPAALRLQ